jgi:hypothetical protein
MRATCHALLVNVYPWLGLGVILAVLLGFSLLRDRAAHRQAERLYPGDEHERELAEKTWRYAGPFLGPVLVAYRRYAGRRR